MPHVIGAEPISSAMDDIEGKDTYIVLRPQTLSRQGRRMWDGCIASAMAIEDTTTYGLYLFIFTDKDDIHIPETYQSDICLPDGAIISTRLGSVSGGLPDLAGSRLKGLFDANMLAGAILLDRYSPTMRTYQAITESPEDGSLQIGPVDEGWVRWGTSSNWVPGIFSPDLSIDDIVPIEATKDIDLTLDPGMWKKGRAIDMAPKDIYRLSMLVRANRDELLDEKGDLPESVQAQLWAMAAVSPVLYAPIGIAASRPKKEIFMFSDMAMAMEYVEKHRRKRAVAIFGEQGTGQLWFQEGQKRVVLDGMDITAGRLQVERYLRIMNGQAPMDGPRSEERWDPPSDARRTERPEPAALPPGTDRPKAIKAYLDTVVFEQDEAKKAASVIVWAAANGQKNNAVFIGPSGCGKTEIWRQLREIYPYIYITDASNITQDGWKGSVKATTFFKQLLRDGESPRDLERGIFVYDEFDKMCAPAYTTARENVSEHIQGEFLKLVEGTRLHIRTRETGMENVLDTGKMTFVFIGAFTSVYKKLYAEASKNPMGFGKDERDRSWDPYAISANDLIRYGVTNELMGRIGHIITLKGFDKADLIRAMSLKDMRSPIKRLEQEFGTRITLSEETMRRLAEGAEKDDMGMRGLSGQIRRLIWNDIYENDGDMPDELGY